MCSMLRAVRETGLRCEILYTASGLKGATRGGAGEGVDGRRGDLPGPVRGYFLWLYFRRGRQTV
jgi:hypothetical protein